MYQMQHRMWKTPVDHPPPKLVLDDSLHTSRRILYIRCPSGSRDTHHAWMVSNWWGDVMYVGMIQPIASATVLITNWVNFEAKGGVENGWALFYTRRSNDAQTPKLDAITPTQHPSKQVQHAFSFDKIVFTTHTVHVQAELRATDLSNI